MKRVVKVIGYILLSSITVFSYSEVLATSGKLRSSSIITCDGVMYGQHGDGHWHKAVRHKSEYYPSGSPVTPPCLTSNNSSSSKKNNSNSNSSSNTKEKESVNLKIESILINNESIDYIKDIMDYTTYEENINLEVTPEDKNAIVDIIAKKYFIASERSASEPKYFERLNEICKYKKNSIDFSKFEPGIKKAIQREKS